jgi:hypothetical protein
MAMDDMLSLLRIAYYGLMAGTFAFLLLWEDGSPLVRGMPSRRRHVLRNLALFVCVDWSVHGCWTFRRGWR